MQTLSIQLKVNGEVVQAQVEPRTHLGDFVRRELGLTGTHLSCEHGVCGACTLLIDGTPQRSCITFAVACAGSEITTVEGYGDDPVMTALRLAFHEHHALQCGYCTPGMLCTARDIVLRLPGPDPARVRNELAGNLCRCTGYVGIVEAIDSVLAKKAAGVLTMPVTTSTPTSSTQASSTAVPVPETVFKGTPIGSASVGASGNTGWQPIEIDPAADWIEVRETLQLAMPAASTWQQLTDLPRVARCLPGAQITRHDGDHAEGLMNIKFGPITAAFAMRAELNLDAASQQGHMRAEGIDQRSATRVKTLLDYQVKAAGETASTVDLALRFRLAGPLAQFSRTGLVNDYVAELTRLFGRNLIAAVSSEQRGGTESSADKGSGAGTDWSESATSASNAGPSLWRIVLARLRRLLGRR